MPDESLHGLPEMSDRIEDLEPLTQAMCVDWLRLCAIDHLAVRVTHTLRSLLEQGHQWAKGRSLPGEPCHHSDGERPVGSCPIHPLGATVTNAQPGQSPHNYGAAFDFCFRGAVPYPSLEDPRWLHAGRLGEALGLSWGGPLGEGDRFTFDRPHLERSDWRVLRGGVPTT
jgi:hypothetical protein